MGLMVHSLDGFPKDDSRKYFIYLLDYGWNEPLYDALKSNFSKMSGLASRSQNSVVVMKADEGVHFSDEVLSWHNINGDDAEKNELLPAILVTNRHPQEFKDRSKNSSSTEIEDDLKLVLFPLKKHCSTTSDVVNLIQKIFNDIALGKGLEEFAIVKQKKKGIGGALVNSIMLEPNFAGVGFSFNKLYSYIKE